MIILRQLRSLRFDSLVNVSIRRFCANSTSAAPETNWVTRLKIFGAIASPIAAVCSVVVLIKETIDVRVWFDKKFPKQVDWIRCYIELDGEDIMEEYRRVNVRRDMAGSYEVKCGEITTKCNANDTVDAVCQSMGFSSCDLQILTQFPNQEPAEEHVWEKHLPQVTQPDRVFKPEPVPDLFLEPACHVTFNLIQAAYGDTLAWTPKAYHATLPCDYRRTVVRPMFSFCPEKCLVLDEDAFVTSMRQLLKKRIVELENSAHNRHIDDVEKDLGLINGLIAEIDGQYLIDKETGRANGIRAWWQLL